MDTGHCPKCNAATVIGGSLPELSGTRRATFMPTGMEWWRFHWVWWPPSCSPGFQACLMCGLVWTRLRPEELRTFIDKYGTDEARLKLSPFGKGPPDLDLA
jgi:hypothetical protein